MPNFFMEISNLSIRISVSLWKDIKSSFLLLAVISAFLLCMNVTTRRNIYLVANFNGLPLNLQHRLMMKSKIKKPQLQMLGPSHIGTH